MKERISNMLKRESTEVTLALPCYNESENIVSVLEDSTRHLQKLNKDWEILVVDNCSTDGTPDRVRDYAQRNTRVRLLVHDCNRLYSGSCKTIIENSRGRFVALMDSDGQFSAADLPAMMAELGRGANLVFGWRKKRFDPWSRKAISLVFNGMGKIYLRYPLHDLNVGLRMFDRRFMSVADIRHRMNMANAELFVRARQAGLRVTEVPVRHAERNKGQTCHNFAKLGRLFLGVLAYFRELRRDLHLPISAPPAAMTARDSAA
jgi:glycosyltransferase involved in cell wall biosynthesis